MVLDVGKVEEERIQKYEKFLGTGKYKELAQSTQSFNRKLNEDRKMRIPYVDGQTGVAMKHYNNYRVSRERMPGKKEGQLYSYPQKKWHKKSYQYLQYFMLPKHLRFYPPTGPNGLIIPPTVSQRQVVCQVTSPKYSFLMVLVQDNPALVNEDSNSNSAPVMSWGDYMTEEDYALQEERSEPGSEDSDFEYEGGRNKKKKGGGGGGGGSKSKGGGGGGGGSKSKSKKKDGGDTPQSERKSAHFYPCVGMPEVQSLACRQQPLIEEECRPGEPCRAPPLPAYDTHFRDGPPGRPSWPPWPPWPPGGPPPPGTPRLPRHAKTWYARGLPWLPRGSPAGIPGHETWRPWIPSSHGIPWRAPAPWYAPWTPRTPRTPRAPRARPSTTPEALSPDGA